MSRLKQIQIIDNAIVAIASIAESQCSLSENDRNVLNETLKKLHSLKRKKGKTNKLIQQEIAEAISLLITFFQG
jgi:hypothetical protein